MANVEYIQIKALPDGPFKSESIIQAIETSALKSVKCLDIQVIQAVEEINLEAKESLMEFSYVSMESYDGGFSAYSTKLILPKHRMANMSIGTCQNMISRNTIAAVLNNYRNVNIQSL